MKRSSGVLMHLSSLHGDYSIGSFGREAREFVDLLVKGGFSYWQVLPFCMADDCRSPYKSYSAFAGNPLFIDLPTLSERGLLTAAELENARQHSPYLCEYDRLERERLPLLRVAHERISDREKDEIRAWISDFPELAKAAEFLALKQKNNDLPWHQWTDPTPDERELSFWQWIQFAFFHQWQTIKSYANERGLGIIGDLPIYVALDSCDLWANPEQFLLDDALRPTAVAGVPPDYFSEEGQLWGNPLYRWDRMAQDGFAWWSRRIEYMLTLFDGIRIDHFRGLDAFWSIPAEASSAKEGHWVQGPGQPFIDRIRQIAKDRLIIAEDLGEITPSVEALLQASGFPGMRVLQFGFLSDEDSPHLPHHYPKNSVAYSGTHDNNTLLGYVWEMPPQSRARLMTYCHCEGVDWRQDCRRIVKVLLSSHADTVIFPIQDLLGYGADTRMNTPGTAKDNWAYRITKDQLSSVDTEQFRFLNQLYGRI